jgi:putative glutamine amidotransferase
VIACERAVEGEPAQAVKHRYLEAVERHAGAAPLIIPSNQPDAHAADLVARLDAVLLTGSNSNIDPVRYGSSTPRRAPTDPRRDGMSSALIHAAVTAGKPLFGICRGLQEINVAFGGTLRDLRASPGHELHHAPDGVAIAEMFGHSHDIEVVAGSFLARITESERMNVNSVHYQTIDQLAPDLVAEAVSADGVIEALWAPRTRAPVFAVQWHPEWRPEERPLDLSFWRALGEAARGAWTRAVSA